MIQSSFAMSDSITSFKTSTERIGELCLEIITCMSMERGRYDSLALAETTTKLPCTSVSGT